jgi:uncharacterized membrane protein YfcA
MVPLLVLAAFATSVLSGIFGMAGGLILMGVLTAALPVPAAMVLHGTTQVAANGSRMLTWRAHVDWMGLAAYAGGSVAAFALLRAIHWVPDPAVVLLVLGAVPFVARALPRSRWLDFGWKPSAALSGFLVGGVQLIAGVAGPLLDVFFLDDTMDRRAVVATKAATQVLSHALKLAYFVPLLADGSLPAELIVGAIAAALAGTAVGSRMLEWMSDRSFRSATRWIVLGLGSFYLWRGVVALAAG